MRFAVPLISLLAALVFVATCDAGFFHEDLAHVPDAGEWSELYAEAERVALADDSGAHALLLATLYRAAGERERAIALTDRAARRVMAHYEVVSPAREALWPRVASAWHAARSGRFDAARAELRDYLAPLGELLFGGAGPEPMVRRTEFGFSVPPDDEWKGLAGAALLLLHLESRGAVAGLTLPLPRWKGQLPRSVAAAVELLVGELTKRHVRDEDLARLAPCTEGERLALCAYANALQGHVDEALALANRAADKVRGDASEAAWLAQTWLLLSGPTRALDTLVAAELPVKAYGRAVLALVRLDLAEDSLSVPLTGGF